VINVVETLYIDKNPTIFWRWMSPPSGIKETERTYFKWTFRNMYSLSLVTSAYSPSQQVLLPHYKTL